LTAAPVAAKWPPRPNKPPPVIVLEQRFLGYGKLGSSSADQDALNKAIDWLKQDGRVGWVPPADFFRSRKEMWSKAEPTEQERQNAQDLKVSRDAAGGPIEVVAWELKVDETQVGEWHQKAREKRMTERQGLFARVMAGVLALLVVCGGYLRLEEATRGYYTLLLRAAALAVLVAVGAGLWLLR
jgi:hypothetical protein